jgi:Immunity protein 42
MMIGNPTIFAIESEITRAYERLGFRALGFFVLHVGGRRYGVYKPDATMLANSFDEVQERIAFCYKHTAPFATEPDGGAIADAFRNAIYADKQRESFFGIPLAEFCKFFYAPSNVMWAPDGDEAFDDGSFVLQFDVESRVRLIAFKSDEGYCHAPNTLSDIWLPADDFYNILREWHDAFDAEWASAPKSAENS